MFLKGKHEGVGEAKGEAKGRRRSRLVTVLRVFTVRMQL